MASPPLSEDYDYFCILDSLLGQIYVTKSAALEMLENGAPQAMFTGIDMKRKDSRKKKAYTSYKKVCEDTGVMRDYTLEESTGRVDDDGDAKAPKGGKHKKSAKSKGKKASKGRTEDTEDDHFDDESDSSEYCSKHAKVSKKTKKERVENPYCREGSKKTSQKLSKRKDADTHHIATSGSDISEPDDDCLKSFTRGSLKTMLSHMKSLKMSKKDIVKALCEMGVDERKAKKLAPRDESVSSSSDYSEDEGKKKKERSKSTERRGRRTSFSGYCSSSDLEDERDDHARGSDRRGRTRSPDPRSARPDKRSRTRSSTKRAEASEAGGESSLRGRSDLRGILTGGGDGGLKSRSSSRADRGRSGRSPKRYGRSDRSKSREGRRSASPSSESETGSSESLACAIWGFSLALHSEEVSPANVHVSGAVRTISATKYHESWNRTRAAI